MAFCVVTLLLEFSVRVRAFVIGLSQISSFFLFEYWHTLISRAISFLRPLVSACDAMGKFVSCYFHELESFLSFMPIGVVQCIDGC